VVNYPECVTLSVLPIHLPVHVTDISAIFDPSADTVFAFPVEVFHVEVTANISSWKTMHIHSSAPF